MLHPEHLQIDTESLFINESEPIEIEIEWILKKAQARHHKTKVPAILDQKEYETSDERWSLPIDTEVYPLNFTIFEKFWP